MQGIYGCISSVKKHSQMCNTSLTTLHYPCLIALDHPGRITEQSVETNTTTTTPNKNKESTSAVKNKIVWPTSTITTTADSNINTSEKAKSDMASLQQNPKQPNEAPQIYLSDEVNNTITRSRSRPSE
jgi:hypothetical protein